MDKRGALGILALMASFWFPLAIASSQEVVEEVYLLVRERELLAFSAVGDRWVTQSLRPNERVLDSKYDGHVAVVFTQVRVLGFSALTNRWSEEKLMLDEEMVTIDAKGNVGAVVTNLRALGFSAKTGRWIVKRFGPK
jgi:hypothetical protein